MALIYIKEVTDGARLGLWHMDEEPEQLLDRYPHLRRLEIPYKNATRQREFLCVRALLHEMTGDDTLQIDHEESGRPVVNGWLVSISHTRGYAVLMLAPSSLLPPPSTLHPQAVGVDIEYRSDRIAKIASHFIRPDESSLLPPSPEAVEQMLVLWCAKETLYKLHSEDNLHYFDMRSQGMQLSSDGGTLTLENLKRGEQVTIHVALTPEYCLTWAVENP